MKEKLPAIVLAAGVLNSLSVKLHINLRTLDLSGINT